jgi:hypothetical protein
MVVFGLRSPVFGKIAGVVLFLFLLVVFALARDSRPWDATVVCPRCQSDRVVYILYGEPILDEDLKRAIDSGKVELGGCEVTRDSKRWECRKCKNSWGKALPENGSPP